MVTPFISTSFLQVLSSRPPRGKSRRVSFTAMSRYSNCIIASYVRGACRMTRERWPGMLAWGLDCPKTTAETRVSPTLLPQLWLGLTVEQNARWKLHDWFHLPSLSDGNAWKSTPTLCVGQMGLCSGVTWKVSAAKRKSLQGWVVSACAS